MAVLRSKRWSARLIPRSVCDTFDIYGIFMKSSPHHTPLSLSSSRSSLPDTLPFNVILLGDPASGKGTQSAHLARHYGMYDLDMGKEVNKPSVRAQYDYAATTAQGKLTPTDIVRHIFVRAIAHMSSRQGIVFSGTPKMIGEAKLVARLLKEHHRADPLVIYISIPLHETLQRMHSRHVYVNGKKVVRDDDNEKALANRRKYYKEQISRVVAFFKERYGVVRISGMGSEKEVYARIEKAVARHCAQRNRVR